MSIKHCKYRFLDVYEQGEIVRQKTSVLHVIAACPDFDSGRKERQKQSQFCILWYDNIIAC